ncbi:MAG: SMI1/KNR4 family protein [Desulfovibrionaceae bacterium]|nr:SMI1/KNR4 family protein [Desulfovibrionaceae bacterium]
MPENTFRKCEAPATDAELDGIAERMGLPLPEDFKTHYRKNNGGVPERAWWDSLDEYDPCSVTEFCPIGHGRHTLEATLEKLRAKKLIPDNLLPFAYGPYGYYFCLDLKTGAVFHYATEGFQPEKTQEYNFKKAQRKLSRSFTEFVKGLVGTSELDCCS